MSIHLSNTLIQSIQTAIDPQRLLDTAIALVEIPSPTRSAGAVANRLAEILAADGFTVERPTANWPEAPAVAVRFDSGRLGRVLQFDGHLDTVHLPFVPPRFEDGHLYGSGASDMKGGIAAFVEALRALRQTNLLQEGGILLTAHDHHEGPWGDRRQVKALIEAGYVGDAVMLPEYLADRLPVAGRGMGIFEITIRRQGEPVHEVLRPADLPDVLAIGAQLALQFKALNQQLEKITHPHAGNDSIFVGQLQAGEIYNQAPVECRIQGTRRWTTPDSTETVTKELQQLLTNLAERSQTEIDFNFEVQGDAFEIKPIDPLVTAFQAAHQAITGQELPLGGKPFVDDGNTFAPLGGIPALTHGPNATGAHTLQERVPLAELVRVAQVYALTALRYCQVGGYF
jgi:acetylornithine deacetylase/succinyl-diaminopimelate desuccinylase-like protein